MTGFEYVGDGAHAPAALRSCATCRSLSTTRLAPRTAAGGRSLRPRCRRSRRRTVRGECARLQRTSDCRRRALWALRDLLVPAGAGLTIRAEIKFDRAFGEGGPHIKPPAERTHVTAEDRQPHVCGRRSRRRARGSSRAGPLSPRGSAPSRPCSRASCRRGRVPAYLRTVSRSRPRARGHLGDRVSRRHE